MARRKTSIILRKERQDLIDDLKALEARIQDRAKQLCKKFPDAPIGRGVTGKNIDDYRKAVFLDINENLEIIANIEKYNEERLGTKQAEIVFNKPDLPDFIEYEDNGDDYEPPVRTDESQVLEIRLCCMHNDFSCNKYIKGKEGYNGAFTAETGQRCDLRNQGFTCEEHGGGDKD